jgi:hypothetical protein
MVSPRISLCDRNVQLVSTVEDVERVRTREQVADATEEGAPAKLARGKHQLFSSMPCH